MSELTQSSVDALERAIDAKIRRAARGGQSTCLATVTKVGSDGTTWVQVFGGAEETPVRRMTTAARAGDVINVTFSGLSCVGVGNVTSPSATEGMVRKVESDSAKAIAGVMGGILQVRQLLADKVSTGELTAEVAQIMEAQVDTLTANVVNAIELRGTYARADFANVNMTDVGTAKIVELLANSGIFRDLSFNDGAVTGTLTAVEVLGDLIRANTVLADKIVYPGSDGMYYMLNYHGGYYEAEPESGDDPSGKGWYELGPDNAYFLTKDTAPASGKTYYVLDESKAIQMDQAKYAHALDGSRIVAKSVTANEVDTESLTADTAFINSLRTLMLLTEAVQIGATGKVHVEMSSSRFSFLEAGYSQPADMSGVSADIPLPGEVAYIAVDEGTGDSMFYMTRAVVVKDLRFGGWKWYDRANGNLALKWMGGTAQ